MILDLDGRNAIVCGASRGIGRACAIALAELGACVTLLARDEDSLRETLDSLPGNSERGHRHVLVDFSDIDNTGEQLSGIVENFGAVHIVVNNSGGPAAGAASNAPVVQYEQAFRQHLLANQVILQAVVPGMKEAGYGRIVNIISTSVKEPIPGLGVSNTIRGAVASWAKTISRELAAHGITVNNVLPGFTATERLDYLFQQRAEKSDLSFAEVKSQAMAKVPAGRFAEPEEIANAVAFLCSPAAAYINGVNLPVDGGRVASL
jgi:3-oxoacyl-[acyl-carrier protein] reductase